MIGDFIVRIRANSQRAQFAEASIKKVQARHNIDRDDILCQHIDGTFAVVTVAKNQPCLVVLKNQPDNFLW